MRPLPLWRQGVLRWFDCCATFSAPPSRSNQEGGAQIPETRAAERCTGVTNAVVGAADGAPVRAERAPPLMGLGEWGGKWIRLMQAIDGGYHLVVHKGGYGIVGRGTHN